MTLTFRAGVPAQMPSGWAVPTAGQNCLKAQDSTDAECSSCFTTLCFSPVQRQYPPSYPPGQRAVVAPFASSYLPRCVVLLFLAVGRTDSCLRCTLVILTRDFCSLWRLTETCLATCKYDVAYWLRLRASVWPGVLFNQP